MPVRSEASNIDTQPPREIALAESVISPASGRGQKRPGPLSQRTPLRRPVWKDWVFWLWIIGLVVGVVLRLAAEAEGYAVATPLVVAMVWQTALLLGLPLTLRLLDRPVRRDWVLWMWLLLTGAPLVSSFATGASFSWLVETVVTGTLVFLVAPAWIRFTVRHVRSRRAEASLAPREVSPPSDFASEEAIGAVTDLATVGGETRGSGMPDALAEVASRSSRPEDVQLHSPGPPAIEHQPSAVSASRGTTTEAPFYVLEQLKRLYDVGAITEQEWATKRAEVLDRL